MDYKEFVNRLGNKMDSPVKELLYGENTVHVVINVGTWEDESFRAYASFPGEVLLDAVELVKDRGGVRGKDYIITCTWNDKDVVVKTALHTTHSFLSDEDFDPKIKRTWTS